MGDAWVNIKPNFAGFKDQVTTGVNDAVKDSAVQAQAATDALAAAEDNLAAAQEREARAAATASDAQARLLGAQREAAAAAEAQAAAQDGDAAAANRVTDAQLRLEAAQSRNSAAALGLAGAQRNTRAATDEVASAQDRATEAHGRGTSALQTMSNIGGPLLLGVAGAVGVVGAGSLVLAANFQQATTQLVTGAGESENAIGQVRQGLLDMAGEVGQTPQKLAEGMFMIESAGFRGADGLNVLKVAAEGARVGGADLETTANAVTTVMTDYGLKANQAADAQNFLTSVVQQGKTHMQDLAGAISTVLPTAAAFKVPLADIGGALAAMTSHGVDADRAATALRFSMQALEVETPKGKDALASVGLSADQVASELGEKGLLATLQTVTDAIGKKFPVGSAEYNRALSDISGGQRGLTATLLETGTNMGTFMDATKRTADQINNAHGQVLGWKQAQGDLNTQLDQAKATGESLGIQIGQRLIPVVVDLEHGIQDTIGWFERHKTVAEGLGAALGTLATVFITARLITAVQGMITNVGNAIGVLGRFGSSLLGLIYYTGPAEAELKGVGSAASISAGQVTAAGGQMAGAGGEITGVGAAAERAGGQFVGMGGAATTAAGEVTGLGGAATAAAGEVTTAGGAVAASEGEMATAGGGASRLGMAFSGLMGGMLPLVGIFGGLGFMLLDTGNKTRDATNHANDFTKQINANAGSMQGLQSSLDSANKQVDANGKAWYNNASILTNWADDQQKVGVAMQGPQRDLQNAIGHVNDLSHAWGVSADQIANAAQRTGVSVHQLGNAGHDAQIAFGVDIGAMEQKIGTLPPALAQDATAAETGLVNAIRFGQAPSAASVNTQAIIDSYNKLNTIPGMGAQALDSLRNNVVQHGNLVNAATVGNVNDIINNYGRLPPPIQQSALAAMAQLNAGLASGNQQAITDSQTKLGALETAYKVTGGNINTDMQTAIDNYNKALDSGNQQAIQDASNKLNDLLGKYTGVVSPIGLAGSQAAQGYVSAMNDPLNTNLGVLQGIMSQYDSTLAGGINPILEATGGKPVNVTIGGVGGAGGANVAGARATGGMVNQMSYFAGEEGIQFPEFVLATNPAYRAANVGYWVEAGKHLGIPGFLAGGFMNPSDVPKPPSADLLTHGSIPASFGSATNVAATFEYQKVVDLITAQAAARAAAGAGIGGSGPPVAGCDDGIRQGLAMPGANPGFGFDCMKARIMNESGCRDVTNTTDSNAAAGHPSIGPAQFVPSTFASVSCPGCTDPHNLACAVCASSKCSPGNCGVGGYNCAAGCAKFPDAPGFAQGGIMAARPWVEFLKQKVPGYPRTTGEMQLAKQVGVFDSGGELGPGMLGLNLSGLPETVLPAPAGDIMGLLQDVEGLVTSVASGGGVGAAVAAGPTIEQHLHLHGDVRDTATLAQVRDLMAQGRAELETELGHFGYRASPAPGVQ